MSSISSSRCCPELMQGTERIIWMYHGYLFSVHHTRVLGDDLCLATQSSTPWQSRLWKSIVDCFSVLIPVLRNILPETREIPPERRENGPLHAAAKRHYSSTISDDSTSAQITSRALHSARATAACKSSRTRQEAIVEHAKAWFVEEIM
jgi:hypothetical protein